MKKMESNFLSILPCQNDFVNKVMEKPFHIILCYGSQSDGKTLNHHLMFICMQQFDNFFCQNTMS